VACLDLLSKYLVIMELRFDVMLNSNIGNENSNAGHIKCSRRPHLARAAQVSHSWYKPTGKYCINLQNFHESHSIFHPFQTFCNFQFVRLYLRNYNASLCEIDAIIVVSEVLHHATFTTRTS